MKKYAIALQGKNFLFSRDGEPGKFSFEARCVVEAPNEEDAGKMALIRVRQTPALREALMEVEMIRPSIRLLEVKELSRFRGFGKKPGVKIDYSPED